MAEGESEPTGQVPDGEGEHEHEQQPPPGDELAGAREALSKANKEAERYRRQAREAQLKAEKLERERETETEKLVREAEQRGREAALAEATTKLVTAEVKAAAAGRFRDPADALSLIDHDELVAEADDGKRAKLIGDALDDIAEAKPYLLGTSTSDDGGERRGLVSQGARSGQQQGGGGDPDAWLRRGRRRRG